MTFEEILDQAIAMLQRRGRLTYSTLKRQFQLDDAALEDLKDELIYGQRVAADEEGRVLVWTGDADVPPSSLRPSAQPASQPVTQEGSLSQTPPLSAAFSPPDAERRQLTVLFCDLVDSTALARQLDPEELREVVRAYQATCAKVIARFEGHIAQYLGDGLLVYFGYPQAHEDDAQRAVRAGLGMVEALEQLNTRLERERGVQLAVRLGIHTGLVVVGEVGGGTRQEQLALGETPNLAARLQGIAAPNTLVISAATFQLLGGFFACQPLGTPLLKGQAQPLAVYRVLYESMARSRLEAVGSTGLIPLVGRAQEIGLLQERWAQVKDGVGQVVLLSGEAGIGKSRLVQVLKDQVAAEPQAWLTPCQCSPYHQNTALYPWIELLERVALRFDREESLPQKLSKLEGFLVQYGLPLAEAASLWDEGTLQCGLHQLVEAEFPYQQGLPPRATYVFKHALIQEAAYQSLLRSTRQQYHQRIAQVLEARFPEIRETQPELVAHHYTEGGLAERAILYWQRARQQALQHSANPEAIKHLTTGLNLLVMLPYTPARAQQELDLQIALGPALMATKGQAAPEVDQTYARTRALCAQLGDTPQLFPTLRGVCRFYRRQGALATARELGAQLYRIAQRTAEPMLLLEAHEAHGHTLVFLGEYTAARSHLEQGVDLADPMAQPALVLRHGVAPGVQCLAHAAHTLWCLGYPEQGLRRSQEALFLAQALPHHYSIVYARFWANHQYHRHREVSAVQAQAEALLSLATAREFPLYVALGACWSGWALALQGQGEAGVAQLRQGLTALLPSGNTLSRPFCLVLLAEAAGHAGQVADGLHWPAEALVAFEATGRGDMLTEAYRL
jgi:class 3 adenylate cyclase/tetratricopeptide (TPR) repeat protein